VPSPSCAALIIEWFDRCVLSLSCRCAVSLPHSGVVPSHLSLQPVVGPGDMVCSSLLPYVRILYVHRTAALPYQLTYPTQGVGPTGSLSSSTNCTNSCGRHCACLCAHVPMPTIAALRHGMWGMRPAHVTEFVFLLADLFGDWPGVCFTRVVPT